MITNIYCKKTTWNTNIFFLPLLKLDSKILCRVFIVMLQLHMFVIRERLYAHPVELTPEFPCSYHRPF